MFEFPYQSTPSLRKCIKQPSFLQLRYGWSFLGVHDTCSQNRCLSSYWAMRLCREVRNALVLVQPQWRLDFLFTLFEVPPDAQRIHQWDHRRRGRPRPKRHKIALGVQRICTRPGRSWQPPWSSDRRKSAMLELQVRVWRIFLKIFCDFRLLAAVRFAIFNGLEFFGVAGVGRPPPQQEGD